MSTILICDKDEDHLVVTENEDLVPEDAREVEPEAVTDNIQDQDDDVFYSVFENPDDIVLQYVRKTYRVVDR